MREIDALPDTIDAAQALFELANRNTPDAPITEYHGFLLVTGEAEMVPSHLPLDKSYGSESVRNHVVDDSPPLHNLQDILDYELFYANLEPLPDNAYEQLPAPGKMKRQTVPVPDVLRPAYESVFPHMQGSKMAWKYAGHLLDKHEEKIVDSGVQPQVIQTIKQEHRAAIAKSKEHYREALKSATEKLCTSCKELEKPKTKLQQYEEEITPEKLKRFKEIFPEAFPKDPDNFKIAAFGHLVHKHSQKLRDQAGLVIETSESYRQRERDYQKLIAKPESKLDCAWCEEALAQENEASYTM